MPALNIIDRFGLGATGQPGAVTVATAYTSGATSLVLSSVTGLPSGACNFWLIVQADGSNTEEVMQCTSVDVGTLTLTVVGAQAGTAASNHGVGANVIASIWTAAAFAQYASDVGSSRPGVLWSGSGDPGEPSIVVSQYRSSGEGVSSLAFSSNVTAGDLLICAAAVYGNSNSYPITMSDSQGNTWTVVATQLNSATGAYYGVAIGFAIAGSTGACTVSAALTGGSFAGTNGQLVIADLASSNLTSTVDSHGNGTSMPALSLTQGYDLVLSAVCFHPGAAATVTSPEAIITQSTYSDMRVALSWFLATSIGSVTSSLVSGGGDSAYVSMALQTSAVSSFGVDGDWYLNLLTGDLWGRTSGIWSMTGFQWA